MKKLFAIVASICMTAAILTSCGGPSWDQERAKELSAIPTNDVTPEQFDEMVDLLDAGWEKCKQAGSTENETEEEADARREFTHIYLRLGGQTESAAYASKRVVSDSQVKAYEVVKERVKNEMIEINRKKAEERK